MTTFSKLAEWQVRLYEFITNRGVSMIANESFAHKLKYSENIPYYDLSTSYHVDLLGLNLDLCDKMSALSQSYGRNRL